MSTADNHSGSYTVQGFAPRRMIPTRQQSAATTLTSDGRIVPRESLHQQAQAPTTYPRGQYVGAPPRSMTAPSTLTTPYQPPSFSPHSDWQGMPAQPTFNQTPYQQPAFSSQDSWQSRWGDLRPGMAVIRMEGNEINAGRSTKIITEGARIATMDIERNKIRTPDLYCSAQGNAVGMNFGLGGDRGNVVNAERDFTLKTKLTGQAEQTHRAGPASANGYGHPANGYGQPMGGYGQPASGYGPSASGYEPPRSGWGPPSN